MCRATGKYQVIICLSLGAVVFVVFSPVIHSDFISFDDGAYVYENGHITSGLTAANIKWAFTRIHANNYHPLTSLSLMLDYEIYGLRPGGYHFTNLLLHIANSVLLFVVFSRMTGRMWASAFVAAMFALHPLHVESVAWISERKDVLSAFFCMLTILSYSRYVERPGAGRYLLTLLMFTLGLLSKPMLVTLPVVMLILDYWPLNRRQDAVSEKGTHLETRETSHLGFYFRLILEKVPFFAFAAVLSDLTFTIQRQMNLVKNFPLDWRVENALVSYAVYIWKLFVPVNLSIFYPHPRGTLLPWKITAALLALVLITIAALWNFRSRPYITAGWLWFLATLVPVIGLIQVGLQARADRYTYIPYIGLFIIIGWGADELIAKLQCRKLLFFICAVVLFLTLGIMTYFQTRLWHNSITLYRHASEAVKDNWWAYDFLGSALAEQGRLDGAITQLEESLRIYPENFDAQQSLAKAYFDSGRVDKAIALYQKMVGPLPEDLNAPINPDFAERVDIGEITEHYAKANIDLGIALLRKGQLDEAAGRFKLALRFMPYSATAHKYLGDIFTRQGRGDEAAKYYAIARRIDPNSVAEKQNCKTEQK